MKRSHIALILVLAVVTAFIFGDFVFISSRSDINASTGVGRVCGNVTINEGFCIYPNSDFGRIMADELQARGEEVVILESPTKCEGQFLAVWVEEMNVMYSPFFSRGSIKAHFIYSNVGDPAHYLRYENATDKEKEFIKFIVNKSEVGASGEIILIDRSKGVMSLKGHKRYLLKRAAIAIVSELQKIDLDNTKCPNSS
ncbi:MAG: hypothetical protein PWQ32_564 [Thermococcaceae archaeon]|nr:hypothetical protein [Thermococcaceae archaeon]